MDIITALFGTRENLGLGRTSVTWPPTSEVARLHRYSRYDALYAGDHRQVYYSGEFGFPDIGSGQYVCVNLFKPLTDLFASRLFGDGLFFSLPKGMDATKGYVDDVFRRCRFPYLCLHGAKRASTRGDAIFRVGYSATKGRVYVAPVSASNYFPITDPVSPQNILQAVVSTIVVEGDRTYLWLEVHSPGAIENMLWVLRSGQSLGTWTFEPEQDRVPMDACERLAGTPEVMATGVDEILLVHARNEETDASAWGTSDYYPVVELMGEIHNRRTQRSRVHDKHVDPVVYGPDISDEEAKVQLRENKYITMPPGEVAPPMGYLVWDAGLSSVDSAILDLTQSFANVTRVDLEALLAHLATTEESGRAIRMRQMTTQTTVKGKQTEWAYPLAKIISLVTKLSVAVREKGAQAEVALDIPAEVAVVEPEDVDILWGSGLPEDRQEELAEAVTMKDLGILSRARLASRVLGLSIEEAQALVDEADADAAAAQPSSLPWEGT